MPRRAARYETGEVAQQVVEQSAGPVAVDLDGQLVAGRADFVDGVAGVGPFGGVVDESNEQLALDVNGERVKVVGLAPDGERGGWT